MNILENGMFCVAEDWQNKKSVPVLCTKTPLTH